MPLAHWLTFVFLIPSIISIPLSSSNTSLSLEADTVYRLSPGPNNVQVVPDGTLDSRFIIGGWDPIFSTFLTPQRRQDDLLERTIKVRAPTGVGVHCHAERYGSPNHLSCGDALVAIPDSRKKITFTQRTGRGDWDYRGPQPLPFRWVSCESPP